MRLYANWYSPNEYVCEFKNKIENTQKPCASVEKTRTKTPCKCAFNSEGRQVRPKPTDRQGVLLGSSAMQTNQLIDRPA
jgi:hypothetical protein